jgi:hypothetical protein
MLRRGTPSTSARTTDRSSLPVSCDSGSEMWVRRTLYIERGSLWANGYCESFNGRLRDERLNEEIFYSLTGHRLRVKVGGKNTIQNDRTRRWLQAACSGGGLSPSRRCAFAARSCDVDLRSAWYKKSARPSPSQLRRLRAAKHASIPASSTVFACPRAMHTSMACDAKGYQVPLRIVARAAAKFLVVDFQVRHASAGLASPAIAM